MKNSKRGTTIAEVEHQLQLQRIAITNYRACYTNIASQSLQKQSTYNRYLAHLEAVVAETEAHLALMKL